MSRRTRFAAVVAAAVLGCAGVASAAPPWADGPTYGDLVTGFDLAVTPDGGVTTASNEVAGGGLIQRTPAGGGPPAPPVALGAQPGAAHAGPVVAGAGDSSLAAYVEMVEDYKIAVRLATVTADGAVGPHVTVVDGLGGLVTPRLALAGDGAGGALVGWVGGSPAGDRAYVRRVHADGRLGPIVQLGAADNTARLTVAVLPDGTARALWLEYGRWELMAARLAADGALDGTPQLISTDDQLEALEPVVDVSAAGAIVAWQEPADQAWSSKQVKIARLPSTGAVAEAPEQVATIGDSENEGVAVALADDGAATVAWSETYADVRWIGVLRHRRVAAEGTLGPAALLSEPAQEDGIDALPRLVETGGGALHAVWVRWTDDGEIAPHARAIAADGTLGPQSEIAPVGWPGGDRLAYPAGAAADGTVTVGWGRPIPDGDGAAIVATATLDTAAPRIEADVPQTVVAGEPVRFRAVAVDPSGIASVRWEFGDGSGIDGAEVTRAYAHVGSYEASVTVTDRAGNVAVARRLVTVVRGRFTATLRLSAALASSRTRATVRLTWRGDARIRPATATKRVAGGTTAPRRGGRR